MRAAILPIPRIMPSRLLAGLLAALITATPVAGYAFEEPTTGSASTSPSTTHKTSKKATPVKKSTKKKKVTRRRRRHPSVQGRQIRKAFVASAQLRPMAQQLATMRTPAAFAGVTAYAQKHTGEAAATAYLALGHAYLLDKRYAEAADSLAQARVK
jgi:soluble lytic murein transglycosylase